MIGAMTPVLANIDYVFVTLPSNQVTSELVAEAQATYREEEGLSLVVPVSFAEQRRLPVCIPMRCITLNIYSDLGGVGLTATVSAALADHNIPCNVIAAYHHDHIYVPSELSERAYEILVALQKTF